MSKELSGVAIIFFIAFGAMTFIILFIFAKRQIMRFTLKSKRGPHVPIGTDAPKSLCKEIERRLDIVSAMRYRAPMLNKVEHEAESPERKLPVHWYRMKALDSLPILEGAMGCPQLTGTDLRVYLLKHLHNCDNQLIHNFSNLYDKARHEPVEFGPGEYKKFMELLYTLVRCVKGKAPLSEPVSEASPLLHQSVSDPGPGFKDPNTVQKARKLQFLSHSSHKLSSTVLETEV